MNPEQRRERVIDFAYGNAALENPRITREMVRRAYDRLHAEDERATPHDDWLSEMVAENQRLGFYD